MKRFARECTVDIFVFGVGADTEMPQVTEAKLVNY